MTNNIHRKEKRFYLGCEYMNCRPNMHDYLGIDSTRSIERFMYKCNICGHIWRSRSYYKYYEIIDERIIDGETIYKAATGYYMNTSRTIVDKRF